LHEFFYICLMLELACAVAKEDAFGYIGGMIPTKGIKHLP